MRIALKGINRNRKRLADGTIKTYYYAWKGGPRLEGEPGSPEFHASYSEARKGRLAGPINVLRHVLDLFRFSPDYEALAPRTRKDYAKLLMTIELEFGDFPLAALEDRRARGDFLAWRDRLAVRSRRQADYAYAILARTLAWARNRGLISVNPCERGGRVYRTERSDCVWTDDQEVAFYEMAPRHLHAALMLALWTGQRQGDLLRLRWADYDGRVIRLRQGKTGAYVSIPAADALKLELDRLHQSFDVNDMDHLKLTILQTERRQAWTDSGFRASWRKACIKANISGVSFHDLRGTAVTRLALAGCTVPEIATITGHSLKDVGTILDRHYLNRSPEIGESAIRKLERYQRGISKNVAVEV